MLLRALFNVKYNQVLTIFKVITQNGKVKSN